MRLRPKITVAFFLVSTLVSVLLAIFLYRFVERQLKVELKTRLRDISLIGSHSIDPGSYQRLRAKMRPDLGAGDVAVIEHSPDYARVYEQLNFIRATEPELIRYVYILVPTDDENQARFVVDADVLEGSIDGEEISHYNQLYDVSEIPDLKRALLECTAIVEDDFVWDPVFKVSSVSGYFPIGGGEAGECHGVLGVDITDKNMRAALDSAGSLAKYMSAAAALLALIVSIAMGTVLTRSLVSLSDTVKRFADKDFAARTRIASRDEIGQLGSNFNAMAATIQEHSENLESLVEQRTSELNAEKLTSERLLLNVLPGPIAERLKAGGLVVDRFDAVSVLFADIVGFTAMSSRTSPEEMVSMLDELFSAFDRLAEQHHIEKIKTIGDAYMVVAGVPEATDNHAQAITRMALDMLGVLRDYGARHQTELTIRIGIHTGSVVAGVIGRKKFIYDLWGDTVNTASRMESHGVPGRIHVTETTAKLLEGTFVLEVRSPMEIKGKGMMTTYLVVDEKPTGAPELVATIDL